MTEELEDKDDNSWFDYDEEWDNKMKDLYEERRLILQNSINTLQRLMEKFTLDNQIEDDKLDEFVQIKS
jgi:hypothetical protein